MGLFDGIRNLFRRPPAASSGSGSPPRSGGIGGLLRGLFRRLAPAAPPPAPVKPQPQKPKKQRPTKQQVPRGKDRRTQEQRLRDAEAQRRKDDRAQREYQRKREAEEKARREREERAAKEAARRAEEQARKEEQKRQEAEARKREKEAARKAEKETERELRRRQKADDRKRREEYRERRKKWRAEHDDNGLIDLSDDQIVNQRGNMQMLNTLIKKGYIEQFESKHEAAEFLRVLDSRMWADDYATLYSIVAFQELQDAIRRGLTARDLQNNYNIAAEKKSHSPLAVWEDFVSNYDPDRPGYEAEGHPIQRGASIGGGAFTPEYQAEMRGILHDVGVTDEQMAKSASFGAGEGKPVQQKRQTRKQKKKNKRR